MHQRRAERWPASACRDGWRASAGACAAVATSAARPTMMPACGPPSSLSPEKHTRSTPAATLSWTSGSRCQAEARWCRAASPSRGRRRPARSCCRRPRPARRGSAGARSRPARKLEAWTRSSTAVRSAMACLVVGWRRCDWSCRPRPGRRPIGACTSGMRKPPPISTSWPREMIAWRPCAERRQDQQQRGGVVVGDQRVLGAGQPPQQIADQRDGASRARPPSRSYSRLE